MSGANSNSPKAVSSEGDADTGSVILDISEGLVSSLVEPNQDGTNKTLQTAVVGMKRATKALEPRVPSPAMVRLAGSQSTCLLPFVSVHFPIDLSVQTFSLGSNDGESNVLLVKGISMEVNLEALAQDNNGEE